MEIVTSEGIHISFEQKYEYSPFWIKARERKPEPYKSVLACIPPYLISASSKYLVKIFHVDDKGRWYSGGKSCCCVDFWQYLPDVPKIIH